MKKILFLTLLLCTVLGATIPMSAKACCCCNDNHQNYDTAYPSATADPIQQAEEQGYQKAQKDYHKEAGFQEWRAEKAHRDSHKLNAPIWNLPGIIYIIVGVVCTLIGIAILNFADMEITPKLGLVGCGCFLCVMAGFCIFKALIELQII